MNDNRDRAMNDDTPQTLVGIAFDDPFRAEEFLTAAKRLAANQDLVLRDAVLINKREDGHSVVHETVDPSPGRSALTSAMWTSLFGLLLAGPVGWVAGAAVGAGTGAIAAKVIDLGIPDEWVAWFREAARPGTTILALLVTDLNREALLSELHRFEGAHLVYANLDPATLERIRAALGETGTVSTETETMSTTTAPRSAADGLPPPEPQTPPAAGTGHGAS